MHCVDVSSFKLFIEFSLKVPFAYTPLKHHATRTGTPCLPWNRDLIWITLLWVGGVHINFPSSLLPFYLAFKTGTLRFANAFIHITFQIRHFNTFVKPFLGWSWTKETFRKHLESLLLWFIQLKFFHLISIRLFRVHSKDFEYYL